MEGSKKCGTKLNLSKKGRLQMEIKFRGNAHTNWSERNGKTPIAIVNHVVAGSGSSCDSWFRSPDNHVGSAHFCVWEDGTSHSICRLERYGVG